MVTTRTLVNGTILFKKGVKDMANKYKRMATDICLQVDYKFQAHFRKVPWTDVFKTEDDLTTFLKNVYVPETRTPPHNTFRGYEYIYSFADRLQKGIPLTDAQMRQAKRLALEIYKAIMIQEV